MDKFDWIADVLARPLASHRGCLDTAEKKSAQLVSRISSHRVAQDSLGGVRERCAGRRLRDTSRGTSSATSVQTRCRMMAHCLAGRHRAHRRRGRQAGEGICGHGLVTVGFQWRTRNAVAGVADACARSAPDSLVHVEFDFEALGGRLPCVLPAATVDQR